MGEKIIYTAKVILAGIVILFVLYVISLLAYCLLVGPP